MRRANKTQSHGGVTWNEFSSSGLTQSLVQIPLSMPLNATPSRVFGSIMKSKSKADSVNPQNTARASVNSCEPFSPIV